MTLNLTKEEKILRKKEQHRMYHLKNRTKTLEYMKEYHQINKVKQREYFRGYIKFRKEFLCLCNIQYLS
jgi:hypothetical protein